MTAASTRAGMRSPWDGGAVRRLLVGFAVMIPWPLAGIAATHGLFDRADEAMWMFGGLTGLAAIPLALLPNADLWFRTAIVVVWCAALLVPPLVVGRSWNPIRGARTTLALQGAFSLAQAAMGCLMIVGKSV